MFDIWGFLLQTLTASGVAVLLLVVKGLFKDKLPPKWHFLVWSALGLIILLPAGLNGRYTLFHWQFVVEIIKGWVRDYSFTRVLFPIPILKTVPNTVLDWLFAVYALGVVVFAAKYIISYIRLRLVLRKGTRLQDEALTRIQQIAAEHGIKPCKVVEVQGLHGAFVCGIIRPILAVPTESELNSKIILHELFHLKHRDTFWSFVICLLRCIHWCNPLLIYCANRAINDMESRCDQYVLENLEGEERRDYGRILLSMSNDKFAKTPGSTCINNGGKNIRDRIESIARFKKYPVGMGLVSVCVIIVLTFSLGFGVQASKVYGAEVPVQIALASARSTPCTTYAGAFDTYAKAVLKHNVVYRAMCAPAEMQDEIAEKNVYWEYFLDRWPKTNSGYYIYNLKHIDKNTYEGLLVLKVGSYIDNKEYYYDYDYEEEDENDGITHLAVQNLRVQKENGRWVAIPLEDFRSVDTWTHVLTWKCWDLPGFSYIGTASDIQVEATYQTVHYVQAESNFMFNSGGFFDTTPKPNAEFTSVVKSWYGICTYLGPESEKNGIRQMGLSMAPVYSGGKRPENLHPADADDVNESGGNSNEEVWGSCLLEPDWDPKVILCGGDNGDSSIDPMCEIELPEYCVADLYINEKLAAQLDLHLQEEVAE